MLICNDSAALNPSRPEIVWAMFHPFVAVKALQISKQAESITDRIKQDSIIGSDGSGGKLDGFRHICWTALLVQNIAPAKVRSLGNAHEKANYLYYKKHKKEDGIYPDSISSVMDLRNNEIGIKIGLNNKGKDAETLKNIIITAIQEGNAWILRKNADGDFLDCDGNILIISNYTGEWYIPKCLVKSNTPTPL